MIGACEVKKNSSVRNILPTQALRQGLRLLQLTKPYFFGAWIVRVRVRLNVR